MLLLLFLEIMMFPNVSTQDSGFTVMAFAAKQCMAIFVARASAVASRSSQTLEANNFDEATFKRRGGAYGPVLYDISIDRTTHSFVHCLHHPVMTQVTTSCNLKTIGCLHTLEACEPRVGLHR